MKDFNEIKNAVLSSIGKAADAGKDIANKAAGAGKGIANKAAGKAKAGARIAKLTVEIANEKENMKKAYLEIGKLYYDTHKDDPEGFFIQLCDEVGLAQKSIAEKEAEIEELKSSENDGAGIEVEFEKVVEADEADADSEAAGDESSVQTEETEEESPAETEDSDEPKDDE